MEKASKLMKSSNNVHKEIFVNEEYGRSFKWENKKILKTLNLFTPNVNNFDHVNKPKDGELILNKDFIKEHNCLEIKTNTNVENKFSRPTCGLTINFDKVDITEYNRVSVMVYIKAIGFENFYFHFRIGDKGEVHTASIIPNRWERILWEIDEKNQTEIDKIVITPFLFGCPPEAIEEVSFIIGKVDIEKVEEDYVYGWDLHNRIAYCHSGYCINARKEALTQLAKDSKFYLLNENNEVVYENETKLVDEKLGSFYILDFSDFNIKGLYKIKIDNRVSESFEISNNPYASSIVKSINFLRSLRCGEEVEGVHSACHLNCKTVDEQGNTVPNFGGWHDAGDLSQFEICTAEMANAILDLAIKTKNKTMKERLLEEAKVGINWLLRTRFKDGSRALAVSYSIWRQNELKNTDNSVSISKAEKGPFESFCSASALAVAARCYEDKIFSDWCLRIAKEDFEYARQWYKEGIHTKRWGKNIDSQVCGHGLLAASELYCLTKDKYYIDIAEEYANIVLQCQEKNYIGNSKIRGFFYEDVNHSYVLTYEHRGHEQSPIHGLARILQVYPNIKNKEDIKKGLLLYKEYILNTLQETNPYYLLPGHIYNVNKLNEERFTIPGYMCTKEEGMEILKEQVRCGTKISDDWYLRIFPIAVQRRGFHATLLSKAKAVSMIADTFKDKDLKQIVINQIEWILGKNPFESSTMYGEGYNYHPLYVAFSRQIVGALPVGIQTKGNEDKPYWPTFNNAVFKEIWGHTTGKYLWILADILN